MADATSIPLIQLRNLPKFSGTASDDVTLVAVLADGNTVRYEWGSFSNQFLSSTTIPATPDDPGYDGDVAVGDSVYTYYDGKWGKTPRYTSNWDDITANTRFLYVNEVMPLSETETENLREMVGISPASADRLGIVKGSDSVYIGVDGTMTVPEATLGRPGIVTLSGTGPAAAISYVDTAIGRIPTPTVAPATETRLGGIIASDSVHVGATGMATVPAATPGEDRPGIVRVAPLAEYDSTTHATWATPVALAEQIAKDTVASDVPVATTSRTGIVRPSGSIYVTSATTGSISVYNATTARYGTVRLVDEIPSTIPTTAGLVPSLRAVKNYVDSGAGGMIDASLLPYANATTRGAIIASATVRISESSTNQGQAYVPNATPSMYGVVTVAVGSGDASPAHVTSKAYVDQKIASDIAAATAAITDQVTQLRPTSTTYGLVTVTSSPSDSSFSRYNVPSTQYMRDYVEQSTASTGWNGGTVTGLATFNGGLRTIQVTSPTGTDVLNYAQLQTLFRAL